MSNQETINKLSSIRYAIEEYKGFTEGEKSYALTHLDSWVGSECNIDELTENLAKLSLDIEPFLEESGLINA